MEKTKAAEERRKYFREWREKNKDKVRKYNRQYWERRAEKANTEEPNHEN